MWLAGRGAGNDGVVRLMDWRTRRQPDHPALAQLRGYWEGLRAGGRLPARSEIDPRGIERALEFAFVADRVAPGVARLRLAGMHLNDLLGMEVRGMPLTALIDPAFRDAVQDHVERAFAAPAVVELRLDAAAGIGRPALSARLLLLPLRDERGEGCRLLGGLACDGTIGRAPRRFRLVSASVQEIGGGAEPPTAARPAIEPAEGLADAPSPFKAALGRHLRLVHSAD